MMRILIFIAAVLLSSASMAQHPFLEAFQIQQVAGGVFIRWTLKQGSICQGIQIERRTSELEEFTEVGNIEGVCGNIDEPEDYSFLDTQPFFGQENRYRIVLGGSGASEERIIYIHDFKQEEYVLLQDPKGQFIKLLPRKEGFPSREYRIYTLQGGEERVGSVEVINDTHIATQNLHKGVYLLVVTEQGETVFSSAFLKSN